MSSFHMSSFRTVRPHKKLKVNEVKQTKRGLQELIKCSMWNEVLKLCAANEQKFILSYAVALQHIYVPEHAKVLIDKIGTGDLFTLQLMKAYLNAKKGRAINDLYELLFLIEREMKDKKPSCETIFPVRKKKIGFYSQTKKKGPSSPIVNVGLKKRQTFAPPSPRKSYKSSSGSKAKRMNVPYDMLRKRELRVCFYLINAYVMDKQIPQAILLLEKILATIDDVNLHSILGVLYLSQGQLDKSKEVFQEVEGKYSKKKNQILMNKSYILFAEENYSGAIECLQKVLTKDSTNIMVVNNLAICYLYNSNVENSIKLVENVIKKDPSIGLNEYLIQNLLMFYNMKNQNSKKKLIYELVNRFKGDDFPKSILK